MEEQKTQKKQAGLPEELSEILLVLDKEKMKIQAVKGIGKNGELETVDPTKKNQSQFMRIDNTGDAFSNFFSNFFRQLKDPTKFTFFKVSDKAAVKTAGAIQKQLDNPTKEGKEMMEQHQVIPPDANEKKQNDMETTQTKPESGEYRFKPEQIDWETMSNLGLSKERLEKMNLLDPLLKGYKTNELVPVSINFGSAIMRTDARLSLQSSEDGKAIMALHCVRKEPDLARSFFGHEFSKEDKENLLGTGNMGRVVDLTNTKTGEKVPSIISIDKKTNEIIALRQEWIKIPDEVKGVKLDEEQKQLLAQGNPLHLEGMISKKNEPFDATVQYNADKRHIEFLFDRNNNQKQSQSETSQQVQPGEVPKEFRGRELSDEQQRGLSEGQTVYLKDLVSQGGKEYSGYLTFNKETGTAEFSFKDPEKLKEKMQQSDADPKQTQNEEEKETPAKSKGRKM